MDALPKGGVKYGCFAKGGVKWMPLPKEDYFIPLFENQLSSTPPL
jgi:hypothetical protein